MRSARALTSSERTLHELRELRLELHPHSRKQIIVPGRDCPPFDPRELPPEAWAMPPPAYAHGHGYEFQRGGAAGPWLPTSLSDCASWYRADLGTTTTAGIARWLDLSGSLNHMGQDTALDKPTLSGQALSFDGVDQFLSLIHI